MNGKRATHEEHSRHFAEVNGQDNPQGEAHGWIQWKGTDVCIDLHCSCGAHGHYDGDFLYHYQCKCGRRYALGQTVKLIPLTDEQCEFVSNNLCDFREADHDR